MKSELNNLDIRDEFGIEIHSMKSAWWMKYGILTSVLIAIIVLLFGAIIKYPDIVYGEFKLISNSPSITISLPQEVQIDKVLKYNDENVGIGEHILIFKNNANYYDVLAIKKILLGQAYTDSSYVRVFKQIQNQTFNLGEVQTIFTEYYAALFKLYTIVELKKHDIRIKQFERQLKFQNDLKERLKAYIALNVEEKTLLKETTSLDSILFSKQLYNAMEYAEKKEINLNKAKNLQQQEIEAKRNDLEIISLENAIETERQNKKETLIELRLHLKELTNILDADIENWIRQYVIVSPIEGKLHFLGNIDEKRYIGQDETAIAITPESPVFKAMVKVPFNRAGKIKELQSVNLKLNDYPYREFGFLEGKLSVISDVAGSEYYLATVVLNNTLTTNSNQKIRVKENMGGIAEIIVNDRSLLSRLFEKVIYVFRH